MKSPRVGRIIVAVFAFLFLGRAPGISQTHDSQAAGVLFQQFETVFRSKASLLSSSGERDFVRMPFSLLIEGLAALGKQAPTDVLKNSDAVLVGTKDYRWPSGLGRVRATFCYVVVLQGKNGLKLDRYFKQPVSSVLGSPVWSWSASLLEFGENDPRPSTLYATEVGQSYLLVSNNLEELQQLTPRLRESNEDSSRVLATIREWGDISQHEFWGYRRYLRTGVPDRQAAGLQGVTPAVEALALYEEANGKGVLLLLTSPTADIPIEKIDFTKGFLRFKSDGPGIWQAVVSLRNSGVDDGRIAFGLLWLFGFGVVI
jgi:hypothetical protein